MADPLRLINRSTLQPPLDNASTFISSPWRHPPCPRCLYEQRRSCSYVLHAKRNLHQRVSSEVNFPRQRCLAILRNSLCRVSSCVLYGLGHTRPTWPSWTSFIGIHALKHITPETGTGTESRNSALPSLFPRHWRRPWSMVRQRPHSFTCSSLSKQHDSFILRTGFLIQDHEV